MKVLDFLHYPGSKIQMFAVDRNKKADNYDLRELKIELVPTIILYKSGIELGRIIEFQMSLEEDIVDIIISAK